MRKWLWIALACVTLFGCSDSGPSGLYEFNYAERDKHGSLNLQVSADGAASIVLEEVCTLQHKHSEDCLYTTTGMFGLSITGLLSLYGDNLEKLGPIDNRSGIRSTTHYHWKLVNTGFKEPQSKRIVLKPKSEDGPIGAVRKMLPSVEAELVMLDTGDLAFSGVKAMIFTRK